MRVLSERSFTRGVRVARVRDKLRLLAFWSLPWDIRGWAQFQKHASGMNWSSKLQGSALPATLLLPQPASMPLQHRRWMRPREGLERAAGDSGVCYTVYLITQLARASRTSNWEGALSEHGINVSHVTSVFDFTSEVQDAIDRYISRNPSGATDLSEIAQQSVGEAITSLAGPRTASLFSGSSADVQKAIRSLSTKKGFGELGQRFFGRFVARFLNFYLSRVTAATLGSPRVKA